MLRARQLVTWDHTALICAVVMASQGDRRASATHYHPLRKHEGAAAGPGHLEVRTQSDFKDMLAMMKTIPGTKVRKVKRKPEARVE